MSYEVPEPVPVPADVDMPDKVLAGLTARQTAIAAVAALAIWAGWLAARRVMPLPAYAALAAPVAVAAVALITGQRDGLTLDRLLAAAWRQSRAPRRLVTAPEGVPAPPAWAAPPGPQPPPPAVLAPLWRRIAPDGVIGLDAGGAAAVAAVSTVNFALRSPAEQDALASAYGRWLNSLTGPVQVLVRAGRADLSAAVAALRETAPALPHPALEQAALEHAGFLEGLAAERDVLTRQALLVIREPGHGAGRAAAAPPPAGRSSGPARPPASWRAPTSRCPCWTAGRSPPCSPPAPTPAGRRSRPGGRRCPASRSPPRAGPHEPPPAAGRRPHGPGAPDMPGPAAVEVTARHVRTGDDWSATLAVTGYPAEVTAGWLEPLLATGPPRRHLAHRADPGRGRRRPAAPPARPPGIRAPRRRRPGPARRPGPRGRRGRRPRPGLPAGPGRGQAVPARPVPDRPRRQRGGPGRRDPAVRALAASLLLVTVPATFRSLQGWTTTLPAGTDQLLLRRTMDTAALAASFPFTSPDLPRDPADPSALPGVLYGSTPPGRGWWPGTGGRRTTTTPSPSPRPAPARLPGQAGDPPVPVPGHRVLGDRPRRRVRPPRRGDRRRVHPPGRAGRAPEPVRPARRRAGAAGHPHPPRPVHPHRRRGPAAGRAVPGRAGRPRQGDHDRLPAGRHHLRPAHLGAARPLLPALATALRAARTEAAGRWPTGSSRSPRAPTPPCSPPRPPPAPRGTWSSSASATSPTSCARPRRCSPWTPPGARSPTPPSAGGG